MDVGVSDKALGVSNRENNYSGRVKATLGSGCASLMELRRSTDLRLMMGLARKSTYSTERLFSKGKNRRNDGNEGIHSGRQHPSR